MSKLWLSLFSASAIFFAASMANGQCAFDLSFAETSTTVSGLAGSTVADVKATCTLTASCVAGADARAQGWSFSMLGDANLSLVEISTGICPPFPAQAMQDCLDSPYYSPEIDVNALGLFLGGFEKSELATGPAGPCDNGLVSGVTLSFSVPVTLPDLGTIAAVFYDATIPAGGGTGTISYSFAPQCIGGGQAIETTIVVEGQAIAPTAQALTVTLEEAVDTYTLDWSDVDDLTARAGFTSSGSATAVLNHTDPDGNPADQNVFPGAVGWSYSVVASGMTLTDINTGICLPDNPSTPGEDENATCLADPNNTPSVASGLFNGGFEKSELSSNPPGPCRNGAVSGVVLGFGSEGVSPPIFPNAGSIAEVFYETVIPVGGAIASLDFSDARCRGTGQFIDTLVIVNGEAVDPDLTPCVVNVNEQNDRFILGWEGSADDVSARAGESGDVGSATASLSHVAADGGATTFPGALGWSIAVVPDNSIIEIVDMNTGICTPDNPVTPEDENADCLADPNRTPSDASALFQGGFESSEAAVRGPGNCSRGGVSGVTLSFAAPVTFPDSGSICEVFYRVNVPAAGLPLPVAVALSYSLTACIGTGQPIENVIVQEGLAVTPENGSPCPFVASEVTVKGPFNRGDANSDDKVNIADVVRLVSAILRGDPVGCDSVLDANNDGSADLQDVQDLIDYIFITGALPSSDLNTCVVEDPAEDTLTCDTIPSTCDA